jgi:[glutamine synthetase] adenylyltransferase / [glutamine synthetase]-adenylyl-L-tyrosine phosphorylase
VVVTDEFLARLLARLPEPRVAGDLYRSLVNQKPSLARLFERERGLLADVLALAAWSPWLATTLENNPEYVSWLQRERLITRVRTPDELRESLARFALTNSQLDPHVLLSRFRRRELLCIYLHDLRGARSIAETTEALSSLADAVLEYAMNLSRQELDNRYGAAQVVDERGRIAPAHFCVVALGKLGSLELNYASDIDLTFLYSADGLTARGGTRGQISNREYFVKLAESILRMVGEPRGEGAAYRIDVRLRPHGRVGILANALDEAVRYYESAARDWELQTLIRARVAAGSPQLYAGFASKVLTRVFRPDVDVGAALNSVRLSREEIDRQRDSEERGFNVKLGRGGIREIEFIAQALQVAFAGRDPWLRASHTLISLGRLADRGLITEPEHSQLSDAYHFLRALEHRLQMEHGLQTHSVPVSDQKRDLLGRRMNCAGPDALAHFDRMLARHTDHVRMAYERVFANAEASAPVSRPHPATLDKKFSDPDLGLARLAASIFLKHYSAGARPELKALADSVRAGANSALNPHRALSFAARIASSLDKSSKPLAVDDAAISSVITLCGVSEFFGEMIAGNPSLVEAVNTGVGVLRRRDHPKQLLEAVASQESFREELEALRQAWSVLLVEIGAGDARNEIPLSESNQLLTELAVAGIDAALLSARRELARRYGSLTTEPRIAVLALGRLGSGGMDYGSDLDIVIVYDSQTPSPVPTVTHEEAYARLAELMITALSSITRSGYLYRVDLRLRPDGQKGPLVNSAEALIDYLTRRASIWEWQAYLKLKAVAGDMSLGASVETAARKVIHELATVADQDRLRAETQRVRDRLEKEKVRRRTGGAEIKYGAGGMLDVYFIARYLQLRDCVPDDDKNRTTAATLRLLQAAGSLSEADFAALDRGYASLRAVDHQLRLIVGRSARLPEPEHPTCRDIARRLGYQTAAELTAELGMRMKEIRETYERIVGRRGD